MTSPFGSPRGRRQAGFSLLEVMAGMIVVTLMMVLLSNALQPALASYAKLDTSARLKDLRTAFENAYKEHELTVASASSAAFITPAGTIVPVTLSASGVCSANTSTFAPIGRFLSTSATDIWQDGHGQSFCVYITAPQTLTVTGASLTYVSLAVVSPGLDGGVDAATTLSASGVLTLGGDDKGILIDGRSLANGRLDLTQERLSRIADAYATYFNTRYLSNPSRDVSVDYFAITDRGGSASARYDGAGVMPTTGGAVVSMTSIGAHTILGLSSSDVIDAYGQVIGIDNSSDAVRSPDNSTTSLRTPPFTARISATLPGGNILSRTVVGSY